jgi:hypothetical protein
MLSATHTAVESTHPAYNNMGQAKFNYWSTKLAGGSNILIEHCYSVHYCLLAEKAVITVAYMQEPCARASSAISSASELHRGGSAWTSPISEMGLPSLLTSFEHRKDKRNQTPQKSTDQSKLVLELMQS